MKHVIRRAFWDYEKEEKWLNEMSQKGMQFVDYKWCKYTFEDGEKGEYIYRIEFLEGVEKEKQKYIDFLEENNIKHLSTYRQWVYLRKKASDGAFEIYTDIESQIGHLTRIKNYWLLLGIAELMMSASGLGRFADIVFLGNEYETIELVLGISGVVLLALGIMFLLIARPLIKKIKKLKEDAEVHQ